MLKLKPFRPFVYGGTKDKSAFIAPPYDIINSSLQKELYLKNPYNVIRLILGRKYAGDFALRNGYTRAADFFKKWIAQKIITDAPGGVFILKQNFMLEGKKYRRMGVVARLDWSGTSGESIIPHEKTYRKHRVDRSRLLQKLPLNFSPVFLITEGVSGRIKKAAASALKEAVYSAPGEKGVLYRVPDILVPGLLSFLGGKKFVIADGHHRLRVSKENFTGDPSAGFLMVYICDFSDEGCVILSHADRKTPLDKNVIREVLKTGKLM
ncbi:DUF1015 domain-containing protein, partial [bacterium]|nr:DUF1015 domain-containing protein [bacterium]